MKTLLQSLINPILDYCSPLYNPQSIALKMKLETPIRSFTRKFKGLQTYDYWERLQILKLLSAERRRERFIIILMYKILKELTPNPGIQWKLNGRTGIKAEIPERDKKLPTRIINLRENYFTTFGPKLFNALPREVREFTTDSERDKVLPFKNNLDKYLQYIPDQPHVQGLQSRRAARSNSIIDQITYRKHSDLKWSFCS